jgi:hypothetical protein
VKALIKEWRDWGFDLSISPGGRWRGLVIETPFESRHPEIILNGQTICPWNVVGVYLINEDKKEKK